MKKFKFHIGIDVSKKTLDACLISEDRNIDTFHAKVSNNFNGIKLLISHLKKKNFKLEDSLFCFENTGIYSLPLSSYFSQHNYSFWEVPAIEIKRSKGLTRGKSDRIDAQSIALYSLSNMRKFKPTVLPDMDVQQLKLLNTERDKIIKAIKSIKRTQESKEFYGNEVYKVVSSINRRTVKSLESTLTRIDEEIKKIIRSSIKLSEQDRLIQSIPGVGPQASINLIITTAGFTKFDNWRQMACYAGVAPFEYTSGTSIKKRTKVHHLADKKMKASLHMCALTAIRHNSEIRNYYERKLNEGKAKLLVINNVRAKLLARVFSVIHKNQPYVDTFKFAS